MDCPWLNSLIFQLFVLAELAFLKRDGIFPLCFMGWLKGRFIQNKWKHLRVSPWQKRSMTLHGKLWLPLSLLSPPSCAKTQCAVALPSILAVGTTDAEGELAMGMVGLGW